MTEKKKQEYGLVYLLTNPDMHWVIKMGMTAPFSILFGDKTQRIGEYIRTSL